MLKVADRLVVVKLALSYFLDLVMWLVVIRCVLSWIPNFYNRFVEVVYKLTDPVLLPVQKLISRFMGGRPMIIDLSPIVVFFLIQYVIRPIIYML